MQMNSIVPNDAHVAAKDVNPMNQLIPCPECSRHLRASESYCPFCAKPLPTNHSPRWGATLALGLTIAVTGCSAPKEQTAPITVKPVSETAPTSQGAVVAPTTQLILPERRDAPAYGLAPRPIPKPKSGEPPLLEP
jgi:hypothetical protein